MNKFISLMVAGTLAGVLGMSGVVSAQVYLPPINSLTGSQDITVLQQQIIALTNLLNQLRVLVQLQQSGQVGAGATFQFSRPLGFGMTGDDVRMLQQTLATDPTIYPEGLVTGYFGPLTQAAISRFQQRYAVPGEDGVGVETMAKLNMIFRAGAPGQTIMVPSGLLLTIGPGFNFSGLGIGAGVSISNVSTTGLTGNSAQINWTTNGTADSRIVYSTSLITNTSPGFSVSAAAGMSGSQSLVLSGLQSNATYYFQVVSTDPLGRVTVSPQQTFFTGPFPDATAPVISGLMTTGITGTGARIIWGTNEGATSKVYYSTSPIVAETEGPVVSSGSLASSGNVELTGLNLGTLYYYMVVTTDAAGNTATSSQQVFITNSS